MVTGVRRGRVLSPVLLARTTEGPQKEVLQCGITWSEDLHMSCAT